MSRSNLGSNGAAGQKPTRSHLIQQQLMAVMLPDLQGPLSRLPQLSQSITVGGTSDQRTYRGGELWCRERHVLGGELDDHRIDVHSLKQSKCKQLE